MKTRITALLIGLAAAAVFWIARTVRDAADHERAQAAVTLRAHVSVDGEHVEGAPVELALAGETRSVESNAEGVAIFHRLPAGVEVELATGGYPFTVRPGLRRRLPEGGKEVDVELRIDGVRSVLVVVLDARSGAPIFAATLGWSGPEGASSSHDESTNHQGRGFLRVGRGGRVTALATGYRVAAVEHVGDANEVAPIHLAPLGEGDSGLLVRLVDRRGDPRPGQMIVVNGVVRSTSGAVVARLSQSASSDDGGLVPRFGWALRSGERLELRVSAVPPARFWRFVTVPAGRVASLDLMPDATVTVRGVVRLDGGDRAAAGATVTWSSDDWRSKAPSRVVAGADGAFELPAAPGVGVLEAILPTRGVRQRVEIGPEGREGVVLDLEPRVEVAIEARDAITGRTVHRERVFAPATGERNVTIEPDGFVPAVVVVTGADAARVLTVELVRDSG